MIKCSRVHLALQMWLLCLLILIHKAIYSSNIYTTTFPFHRCYKSLGWNPCPGLTFENLSSLAMSRVVWAPPMNFDGLRSHLLWLLDCSV